MENEINKFLQDKKSLAIFGNIVAFEVTRDNIIAVCKDLYYTQKFQLKTMTAIDCGEDCFKILFVFGLPGENQFLMPYLTLKNTTSFPSLANDIHETSIYESKIQAFFGLTPEGHMNEQRIILHENWPRNKYPLRKNFKWNERPEEADSPYSFTKVEGKGIYEIPVGPVHAGIIEPGHFRFSVAGEEIMLLEAKLGYTHKGTEKLFETLPFSDKIRLSEKVSGDSVFSHSLAFCQAIENLGNIKVPQRAKWLRVIFSEMERLANHFGDIGFIMLDTGFSFGGSNGQRLRETIMQWNERLTGSRFLKSVNMPGGVKIDIDSKTAKALSNALTKTKKDFDEIIDIANNASSLQNRLENTGVLDSKIAEDHGVVGVAGRATGILNDSRIDYPYAAYDKIKFEIAQEIDGDVNARFKVRIKEVHTSIKIILEAIENLAENGEILSDKPLRLDSDSFAVGIAEGWRGEIVYFVATDSNGNISRVDVRDPSFKNWTVLGYAGKGNIVPDFPLINKSFNLSYSGNDL
jgi:Ni,Fe-hydrogenase III large subunit/Ni,Fe-hydrogenase III component G